MLPLCARPARAAVCFGNNSCAGEAQPGGEMGAGPRGAAMRAEGPVGYGPVTQPA